MLNQLQNSEIGSCEHFDETYPQVLPLDLYLTLEKRRKEKREAELAKLKENLADNTPILNTTWATLKESAMADDYKQRSWFASLNNDDKVILEALREAQKNQGDMKELQPATQRPETEVAVKTILEETQEKDSVLKTFLAECEHIHNKVLFDCINDSLL